MAANAAHLTRTLNDRPSVFEVVAQESLHSTIEPALRKVAQFLASLKPAKFGWLVRWFDEVFLLFHSVLQYKYIRYYAASFAENFYGLRRIALTSQVLGDGHHLPSKEEKLSILFLVAFPYLRQKLDNLAQKYRLDEVDEVSLKGWQAVYRKCIIKGHATFHLLYESLSLAQYLAYMSGKSDSPSLPLRLSSLSLNYIPSATESGQRTWGDFWGDVKSGNVNSAKISFEMVGTVLLRTMEVGAFFVQFLKWWEDKGPRMEMSALPIPEPPMLDLRASQYTNKCPICLQKWKIPTVLPVSGYIFCYKCITKHMDSNSNCPVTKYPAYKKDLIRLYM